MRSAVRRASSRLGARRGPPRGSARARTASSPPRRRSRSSTRRWSRTPTCRSACERKKMAAPVITTLREAERQRQRGRGERAEHGEQDQEHDREAGRSAASRSSLDEVLHAGPQRLLADEVWLAPRPRRPARAEVARAGRRRCPRLVLACRRPSSGTTIGASPAGRALRAPRRPRRQRAWGSRRRSRAARIDLGAHVGRRRPGAAREHHGELLALRAVEAVEVALDRLGPRAGNLEAAAREVLGLARGERARPRAAARARRATTSSAAARGKPSSLSIAACMRASLAGWLTGRPARLPPDAGGRV